MVPTRDVDPAELYRQERLALVELLRTLDAGQLATVVPATPAWSVHDATSHLVGIAADLNAQRFPVPGSDPNDWTAHQVAMRRDATVADLAAEWDREGPGFEDGLRLFGHEMGAHYLGDLMHHVSDIHAALGRSPVRDDLVIAVALDFYLRSFEDGLAEAGIGAVEVRSGDERFLLGAGEPVAAVAASPFELFRSLGGRRTLAEVRGLDWSGDVDTIAPLVSRYPLPAASLHEV